MNEKEHLPLIESETDSKDLQANKFKLYRRRWYILSVFTVIALLCNWFLNTWTPISEPCKILFGWENWQVILLTIWTALSILVSSGSSVWLMDIKGKSFYAPLHPQEPIWCLNLLQILWKLGIRLVLTPK